LADEKRAREIALFRQGKYRGVKLAKQKRPNWKTCLNKWRSESTLSLIVKSDVQGSAEAIDKSLQKLSTVKSSQLIHGGVVAISESDINLALASKAIVMVQHARDAAGVNLQNLPV